MTPDEVWGSYHDRLKRFIHRRVRDEHETEDILQDVFARIISSLGTLENPEKLEAWIFQVARRAVVDSFRKRASAPRPLSASIDIAGQDAGSPESPDLAACLRSLVDAAPESDREALRLVDAEGRPQMDLSERLGISLTGAKSRVQRARRRLKEALTACCRIETDRRGNVLDCSSRLPKCRCG